ncbi:MAG: hypothetical protein JWM16_5154, partial [Verrucomicrobiales bacterium]|nr:hypothetical protein [Verrucomicrobiales bacterium]
KAEAPSSGPFAVYESPNTSTSADPTVNSFAESMDRALENTNPASVEDQPAVVPVQSGPEPDRTTAESPSPNQKPSAPALQPSISQRLQCATMKSNAETPKETGNELAFQSSGAEPAKGEDASPATKHDTPISDIQPQLTIVDALCSILMLSSIVPTTPEQTPKVAGEGSGDDSKPSVDSISNSETARVVEAGADRVGPSSKAAAILNQTPKAPPVLGFVAETNTPPASTKLDEPTPSAMQPQPEALPTPESTLPPPLFLAAAPDVVKDPKLPAVTSSGTVAAKIDLQMKNTAENSTLSPSGDLCLLSAATLSAGVANSAVSQGNRLKEAILQDFDKLNAILAFTQNSVPTPDLLQVDSSSPAEPRAVERVEQTILHAAVELKRLGTESMSVVLWPDHQTELHLTLAMNQGNVDVEARISRGDMTHLQAEWGTLQQTLAQQGIRLQPMEQSRDLAQQGEKDSGSSSHFQRQDSGESNRRKTMIEEEMASSQFQFTARTAAARRLWESWA